MNVEFHYYLTYVIARKTGFAHDSAFKIAYSSQYIDDNTRILWFKCDGQQPYYKNYISQTKNIFLPQRKLMRIYPIFHFIPGNPYAKSAERKDGRTHILNCTPNSEHAQNIMKLALQSNNPYQIGIATHGYVDTWAHQNFVGVEDDFNFRYFPYSKFFANLLSRINIGHAWMSRAPDHFGLTWFDERLVDFTVVNKVRFMDAASKLYDLYAEYNGLSNYQDEKSVFFKNLNQIVKSDQYNRHKQTRIRKYLELLRVNPLHEYDKTKWFNEMMKSHKWNFYHKMRGLLKGEYTLTDAEQFKESDWYKFQEAIKIHQKETIAYLNQHIQENIPNF